MRCGWRCGISRCLAFDAVPGRRAAQRAAGQRCGASRDSGAWPFRFRAAACSRTAGLSFCRAAGYSAAASARSRRRRTHRCWRRSTERWSGLAVLRRHVLNRPRSHRFVANRRCTARSTGLARSSTGRTARRHGASCARCVRSAWSPAGRDRGVVLDARAVAADRDRRVRCTGLRAQTLRSSALRCGSARGFDVSARCPRQRRLNAAFALRFATRTARRELAHFAGCQRLVVVARDRLDARSARPSGVGRLPACDHLAFERIALRTARPPPRSALPPTKLRAVGVTCTRLTTWLRASCAWLTCTRERCSPSAH